jgi:hypothetical protein
MELTIYMKGRRLPTLMLSLPPLPSSFSTLDLVVDTGSKHKKSSLLPGCCLVVLVKQVLVLLSISSTNRERQYDRLLAADVDNK